VEHASGSERQKPDDCYACARGLVDRIDSRAREASDLAPELVERRLGARADVEDLTRDRRRCDTGAQVRVDDHGDVREVARLLAVAEDRGRCLHRAAVMNFGITAAYCDVGSCRAPKTLK
jgi:hypothetical protein